MGLSHSPKIVTDGLVLCLDAGNTKSYPGSLGSELVTTAALTAVDGSVVTVTTAGVSLCNVVAGKSYVLRYTVSAYRGTTGGTFRINLSAGNYTPNLIGIGAVGTYYRIFTANVSGEFSFYPDNTGVDLDIDFVSVKEMLDMNATTWKDLSSRGNNGTLTNGPTFDNNNLGSFVFDGTDKYINGSLPTVSAGASVTIEAVIKLNDVTLGSTKDIINQGRSGITFSYGMIIYGNNLRFRNSNSDHALSSPTTLTTGVWYHLVLSASGSVTTGYCNGINQGTTNVGVTTNSIADYHISRRSSNSATEFMNGNIALIRVYNNKALTSTEVQQNFNALRGRFGI